VSEFSWDRYNREIFQPNIVDPIADVFRHRDELSLTGMLGDAVRGVGSSYRDAFPQPRMDDPNPFRHRTDEEMIRSLWEWLPASSFSAGMLPDAGRQGGKVLVSGMFSKGAKKPWEKSEENLGFLHNSAKKYKTAEEFVEANIGTDLEGSMEHRPTFTGATADNVTQEISDMGLPEDFYDNPNIYATGDKASDAQSIKALLDSRGNPEAEVTIYRASPKNELRVGDWVTLSKEYAEGESLTEGVKAHSFKVKAKDIHFAGDSINEFGYYPESKVKQLTDIWNKTNKADPGETLSEENLDFLQRIPR